MLYIVIINLHYSSLVADLVFYLFLAWMISGLLSLLFSVVAIVKMGYSFFDTLLASIFVTAMGPLFFIILIEKFLPGFDAKVEVIVSQKRDDE